MSDFSLTTGFPQAEDTERLLLARLGLRSGLSFRSTSLTTALASASRTATTASADISTAGARGVLAILMVTTTDATLNLTLGVSFMVSGQAYTIATTPSLSVASLINRSLIVHPNIATATPGHLYSWTSSIVQAGIPATIRLAVGHSNANAITYSVGYILLD